MKTKKIILSLFVGIIALSSAGLSLSLAWYISSSRLIVDTVIIGIDGDAELLISTDTDRSHAKSHLTQSELTPSSVLFKPVTSGHSSLWMSSKENKPRFYEDTVFYDDRFGPTEASEGFYSQELYLFSDRDVYVTLSSSSEDTFIRPDTATNKILAGTIHARAESIVNPTDPDYKFKGKTVDEITEMLDEVQKAMRFSILIPDEDHYNYVIVDPHKEEDTYLGGILDNYVDGYFDYYQNDNSENVERLFGDINDKSLAVYDDVLADDSDYVYPDKTIYNNIFNAKHKSGVRPFNLEKSKENGLVIAKEDSHSLDEFEIHSKTPLNIPVYRDRPNKFVLSIYLEGWDLESINHTMGASFISNLKFIIGKELY